ADAINNRVSVRLARLASDRNIRYIFVSSDVIFDGKRGNYSEKDKPNPVNFYASTKINAEKEILKICKDAVIVRPALFYGTAFKGRPSFTEIMLKNLYAGRQVFVFSDQYRSPISVKDLAKSIWELADHHFCGIIHLGGPEKLSRLEMGYLLCQIFSLDDNLIIPIRSEEANLAASRPPDCSLDSSLAASLLKTNIQDYKSSLQLVFR
ncbi:MAG: NAD-dependent epimerase/dehydratase family protein, partial [Calditrichaeota bacterium]